jgi:Iap family predicted aminopeptidase
MTSLLLPLLLLAVPSPSPEDAAAVIGQALTDGLAYQRLTELTDTIGPRPAGSAGAAQAVDWARKRLAAEGFVVHTEPVKVPHWVRGVETGELVLPSGHVAPLALTALGGSAPTPAGGITAPVLEVTSFEQLHALGDRAKGKIIFFNHPMAVAHDYGVYGALRFRGAAEASRAGAAAMVMRSLSTASLRSPHTGMTFIPPGVAPLPAAALSVEDAGALHRALAQGPAQLHLTLGCQTLPEVESANVVAELKGSALPKEVVLLGAHLDSWDLATGAQDDGAGVAMVMETARVLAHLRPRRTVRLVLFMNEEFGLDGGKAYAKAHATDHHVAALEADSGAGRPMGVALRAGPGAEALLAPWLAPLATLGSETVVEGEAGGADLEPLAAQHVPMLSIHQDGTHYFDVHHSAADTLDKVDPQALASSAGALAWLTYALAEAPFTLPAAVDKAEAH